MKLASTGYWVPYVDIYLDEIKNKAELFQFFEQIAHYEYFNQFSAIVWDTDGKRHLKSFQTAEAVDEAAKDVLSLEHAAYRVYWLVDDSEVEFYSIAHNTGMYDLDIRTENIETTNKVIKAIESILSTLKSRDIRLETENKEKWKYELHKDCLRQSLHSVFANDDGKIVEARVENLPAWHDENNFRLYGLDADGNELYSVEREDAEWTDEDDMAEILRDELGIRFLYDGEVTLYEGNYKEIPKEQVFQQFLNLSDIGKFIRFRTEEKIYRNGETAEIVRHDYDSVEAVKNARDFILSIPDCEYEMRAEYDGELLAISARVDNDGCSYLKVCASSKEALEKAKEEITDCVRPYNHERILNSEYFCNGHLRADAPDEMKQSFEEWKNDSNFCWAMKDRYPEMKHPYQKWNGEIIDIGQEE